MDKDNKPILLCCYRMDAYERSDWVFLENESSINMPTTRDFFYVYDCIFRNLNIELPFDDFTMSILYILNMAISQLHLNGWAAKQVFHALCKFFRMEPTAGYSFTILWPSRRIRNNMSLIWHQYRSLFRSYSSSYKNFKVRFCKVIILPGLGDDNCEIWANLIVNFG